MRRRAQVNMAKKEAFAELLVDALLALKTEKCLLPTVTLNNYMN
jgi:hypothetical protein